MIRANGMGDLKDVRPKLGHAVHHGPLRGLGDDINQPIPQFGDAHQGGVGSRVCSAASTKNSFILVRSCA